MSYRISQRRERAGGENVGKKFAVRFAYDGNGFGAFYACGFVKGSAGKIEYFEIVRQGRIYQVIQSAVASANDDGGIARVIGLFFVGQIDDVHAFVNVI